MVIFFQEISQPENLWFTCALGLMLVLGLLQAFSLIAGLGAGSMLDNLLPEGVDADSASFTPDNLLAAFMSWLNLGRVPLIVSLIAFLFIFSCIGLNLQGMMAALTGARLPGLLAVPAAIMGSIPLLRYANAGIARIMPRDETAAVSSRTFIGRVATISLGKASTGRPAEAKLKGPLGRVHYIMVEPDVPGAEFVQGDEVLVVRRLSEANFTVIAIENKNLINQKKSS